MDARTSEQEMRSDQKLTGLYLEEMILSDYQKGRTVDRLELGYRPDLKRIHEIIERLFSILFLGYYPDRHHEVDDPVQALSMTVEDVRLMLRREIANVLPFDETWKMRDRKAISLEARELSSRFLSRIPHVRSMLNTDIDALVDGDPAAENRDIIIFAYPGFYAIAVYRLAHEMVELGIPMIPRIMSEHAHSKTGIDINPGATIGEYFFIDHGTGIVIGETTVIGEHVKLYQGVTLGALSTRGGQKLKGKKRHPTIEDNVTLYACASVLGDTRIGHDSVIGSNVFITEDVAPDSLVTLNKPELTIRQRKNR